MVAVRYVLLVVPRALSFDGFVVCCVMVGCCSLFGVECCLLVVIVFLWLYVVRCAACVVLGCRVMAAIWRSLWCFGACCLLCVVCLLSFDCDAYCVLHCGSSVCCLMFVCGCMVLCVA